MTPAETARSEAGKQAVILAFGFASLIVLAIAQRRGWIPNPAADMLEATRPDVARETRMREAAAAAKRFDRLATVLFRFGPARSFWWAADRAERARAAYEAERP